MDAILSHGIAEFVGESALAALLGYWAEQANQQGVDIPLPDTFSYANISVFAAQTLNASVEAEGNWAPKADAYPTPYFFELYWEGTSTKGRYVEIRLYFQEDGSFERAELNWDSATNKPSTFLAIERLLVLPGVTSFQAVTATA